MNIIIYKYFFSIILFTHIRNIYYNDVVKFISSKFNSKELTEQQVTKSELLKQLNTYINVIENYDISTYYHRSQEYKIFLTLQKTFKKK